MSATKLLIAGHGLMPNGVFDPGATGLIPKGEHRYFTEDLFPALRKYIPPSEKVVFITDYNVRARGNLVSLAKSYGDDTVVIEFHFDAAGNAAAKGGHVIIQADFAPDALDLRLRDAIGKLFGIRTVYNHRGNSGISGRSDLANPNRAKSGGVNYRLPELGFGTNPENVEVLTKQTDKVAKTIAEAIFNREVSDKTPDEPAEVAKPKPIPEPSKPANNAYTGGSIVEYLNSVNVNSSIGNRKKLGVEYGIVTKESDYTGTAQQNTALLNAMRSGKKPVQSTPTPAQPSTNKNNTSYKGSSIVDYLNLSDNKHLGGSSLANRRKLATANGINNYNGTAAQNTQLLNALRGGGSTNTSTNSAPTIDNIARQILRGIDSSGARIPNGHSARQKHFNLSKATYDQVAKKVNQLSK